MAKAKKNKKATKSAAKSVPKGTTKKTTKKSVGSSAKKMTKKAASKVVTKKASKKASKTTVKKSVQKSKAGAGEAKAKATKAAAKSVNPNSQKPVGPPVGLKSTESASGPQLGDKIPDFTLASTDGEFSLSAYQGQKVVLYFYPKDATPGCTIEGHDFSRLKDQFHQAGAVVYGVSRDDMKSHQKFKDKECYTVDLLSDSDEVACKIFDVIKMKNMYGKMVQGIERSTFVIDAEGRLAKAWRKVSVEGHAQQVLESLKDL